MKVSIIIPVYNVEKYIKRCFDSVVAQTYDNNNIECIFIDDCSPDNCNAMIKEMIASYSGEIGFKLVKHEQNKGLSGARNTGIREASGAYLYFFDSDDEITSDCIESMIDILNKYSEIELIISEYSLCNNDNKIIGGFSFSEKTPLYLTKDLNLCSYILNHKLTPSTAWNKLVSRDFIIKNKLYFEEGVLHEDILWEFSISRHINKLMILKKKTYKYYINNTSIMASVNKLRIDSWNYILEYFSNVKSTTFNKLEYRYFLTKAIYFLYYFVKSPYSYNNAEYKRLITNINNLRKSKHNLFEKIFFLQFRLPIWLSKFYFNRATLFLNTKIIKAFIR